MRNGVAWLLVVSLLANTAALAKDKTPPSLLDARVVLGVRTSACRMTSQQGGPEAIWVPILAALLPTLLEKGLGLVSGAMKRAAGADDAVTTYAAANGDLFLSLSAALDASGKSALSVQRRNEFECIGIVIGRFSDSNTMTGELKPINQTFPGLADDPLLYLELGVVQYSGGAGFRLVPRYLWYGRSAPKGDLAITLSFSAVGSKEPFGIATLVFSQLDPGTALGYNALKTKSSTAIPFPPADERVTDDVKAWAEAGGDTAGATALANKYAGGFTPVSLSAELAFTKNVKKLLAAAAEVLDSQKKDLAEKVTAIVLPDQAEKQKSEIADAALAQTADETAFDARIAVEDYEAACKAGEALAALREKAKTAYQKKRAANAAALSAAKSHLPYPNPTLVDPAADSGCKKSEPAAVTQSKTKPPQ